LVKLTNEHTHCITNLLDNNSYITMGIIRNELYKSLTAFNDRGISPQQIHKYVIQEIHFTLKRTKAVEGKKSSRHIIESRKNFVEKLQQLGISYKTNCIFVNQAGFNANLI
ncbi:MAG: hypothetical protein EXX96DRAFT_487674, partial [Benjaminiella poitrasii]